MYQDGGNDRRYSESIADATYARYLVNADSSFIIKQLDSMKMIYDQWNDHWDSSKNLFYIPAMPDATEYTIASIDASGGKDGFDDGEAFRPSINSYMYGNALAISRIAAMKGDKITRDEYLRKATALRENVDDHLWNDSFKHFTDRFNGNNEYVHYWDFIRGRELAGLVPWYFNLPPDLPAYSAAWKHLMDTTQLLGRFGLRTNEPSYQYYFKQFVFFEGKPGSQWNGPSWPYQTSLVLTGMANLLNNYNQDIISKSDYVKILRLFTQQHYLPDGKLDLVENYEPNKGGPVVHYYWSNHYNHSSFNNLVITGLCGIRPAESDTLTINPLADDSIQYFCLEDILYHGHKVSVVYDKDGSKYNLGKGFTIFVDAGVRFANGLVCT
jgi:Trehalase